ncbi:MAG: TIGR03862 family flavoprotein [Arenimonas sp.]
MSDRTRETPLVAIVGGGPAGLMAADAALRAGASVDLYDALGSVGRKFLLAGKGGLNLTHSEPRPAFDRRFRERAGAVGHWLDALDADGVRAWARDLGVETFIGTSGRVFPVDLKAAPLLRGWLRQLRERGLRLHAHHRWRGWDADGALVIDTEGEEVHVRPDATVLALGGGSWPRLGSDGGWVDVLGARGVDVAPLRPANCGFDIEWSDHFRGRHAGHPLKPVVLHWTDERGVAQRRQGEMVATEGGVEGSLVYAAAADLREAIAREGVATIHLDLAPGRTQAQLADALALPRQGRSLAETLRRRAGLEGVRAGLLHEVLDAATKADPARLAAAIKSLPLRLLRPRPLAEAISTAGGVRLEALDADLMCTAMPGVFCAGEMLDWEAPTGGYLLTASLASGRVAGLAAAVWRAHSRNASA